MKTKAYSTPPSLIEFNPIVCLMVFNLYGMGPLNRKNLKN